LLVRWLVHIAHLAKALAVVRVVEMFSQLLQPVVLAGVVAAVRIIINDMNLIYERGNHVENQ